MSSTTTPLRNYLKVEDLLDLAVDQPILGFKWADAVCNVVNPYLSLERRLTLHMTGTEVGQIIKGLPASVQISINTVVVDVISGEILDHNVRREASEPELEEESIPVTSHGDTSAGYERYHDPIPERRPLHRDRFGDEDRRPKPPNNIIMGMIATTLVVIALIFTLTIGRIAKETNGKMESSTLEVVIKTLGQIFVSSANTNPDTRPNTSGDTSDETFDAADGPAEDEEFNPEYQDDTSQPAGGGPRYGN